MAAVYGYYLMINFTGKLHGHILRLRTKFMIQGSGLRLTFKAEVYD